MCGIFGLITEKSIDPGLAESAKKYLRHRGPDADGEYHTTLRDRRELLFVHTRLSILDLKDGNQPMWDAAKKWVIVYNGEIYNYVELREELSHEGCPFSTTSDTEVLINAISRWGAEKAIPRLNGMFAFAAYCPQNDELIIARDRFGIKPLYIIDDDDGFSFCSELGTLIRLGLTEKKISKAALELYLAQYSLPAPWSMMEGVEKLRPAYFLRIKDGRREYIRYWTPSWNPQIFDVREAIELFDGHMVQALRRQYRSDVPVGLSLSGGLDSCSLLSYSARELDRRPFCYSLAFDESSFDESSLAKEMAAYAGADIRFKTMQPSDLWEQMCFVLSKYGEPFGDWGVGLVAFVSQLACSGHKVLLIGSGGDELFAGYPTVNAYYYANLYRKIPQVFRNFLKWSVDKIPPSSKNMSLDFKMRRFLNGAEYEPAMGHLKYKEIFTEDERKKLLGREPEYGFQDMLSNIDLLDSPEREERLLWLDLNTFMQSNVLAGFDAASMAYSVEMRLPFLDNEFYDFSLQLGPGVKFSRNVTKPLVRKALRGKVPANVQNAPKRGFVYPIDVWFRNEFREKVQNTLDRDHLYDIGLSGDAVLEFWNEHKAGMSNRGRQLSALLSLLLWHGTLIK